MAKQPAYKSVSQSGTLADVVSSACSDLLSLGEEAREICDNMPESLQSTSRYEALDNSAGILEAISEPDVPAEEADFTVAYSTSTPTRKGRGVSRSRRLSDAVGMLEACVAAMEERKEALKAEGDTDSKQGAAQIEGLDEVINEVQAIIDECADLEFPGMFG